MRRTAQMREAAGLAASLLAEPVLLAREGAVSTCAAPKSSAASRART